MNLVYIILLRDVSHSKSAKKALFSVLHLRKINDSCISLVTPIILQNLKKYKQFFFVQILDK